MIGAWLTWFVWLGVLALLYCTMYQAWFALLLGISMLLPLAVMLLYRLLPPRLAVDGDFPQTVKKEERCGAVITVANQGWLLYRRVRLDVVLENALTGEAVRRTLCAPLYPKETARFPLTFCGSYCGVLREREVKVRLYDYFGLGVRTLRTQLPVQTVILPQSVPVEYRLAPVGSADDCWEDYSAARAGQDMSEPFDFRDYTVGDAMNRIHWKLSDKYERLIVREGSEQAEQTAAILLENNRRTDGGAGAAETLSAMAELAVSLSLAFCDDGISHLFGVWNRAGGDYDVYEIGCEDDLICLLPRLFVTAGEGMSEAAACGMEREALRQAVHLLIVTNGLPSEWLETEPEPSDGGQRRTVLLVEETPSERETDTASAPDVGASSESEALIGGACVLHIRPQEPHEAPLILSDGIRLPPR